MQIKCKFFPTFIDMTSPSITITLDTRRAKKDGSFPLVLRLSFKGLTSNISLGYDIPQRDWDGRRRRVKRSFEGVNSVSRLNHELVKRKADALDQIKELQEKDLLYGMTIQEVKRYITKEVNSSSFLSFTESLIEDLKKVQKFGNAASYYTLLGVLRRFIGSRGKTDLEFKEVNYKFLKQFETAHLAKGNSLNGLAVYMRTIRAIYNKAIKEGLVEKDKYPFDSYKIRTEPTKKRAISLEDIRKVINLQLNPR